MSLGRSTVMAYNFNKNIGFLLTCTLYGLQLLRYFDNHVKPV